MVPDGRTDGRTEWTDGRTEGRSQNYIPPTSSGDNKLGRGHLDDAHTKYQIYMACGFRQEHF